jgi:hypothetical protein
MRKRTPGLKRQPPTRQGGLAWYSREEWTELRGCAADPEVFHDTYDEWAADALATLRQLRRDGVELRKVEVTCEELRAWCKERGVPLDGKARSEYVTRKMAGLLQGPHQDG